MATFSHRTLGSALGKRLSDVAQPMRTLANLKFSDKSFEHEFQQDRRARTYRFSGNAIAFGAALWAVFAIWDPSNGPSSTEVTRFRFLVAIPTLLAFFAITFTPMFRQSPDLWVCIFTCSASLLAIKQLLDYGIENPYYLSSGSSALNFALILVFCIGLFPISFLWSFFSGAMIISIYIFGAKTFTAIETQLFSSYVFNLIVVYAILTFMSYGREKSARAEFARNVLQEKEKNKLSKYLSSYIPLEMVDNTISRNAESFGEVTLMFSDLVGFTGLTEHLAPKHVVEILDTVFSAFDESAERHGIEKVKTIGDAYMAIAGKSSGPLNHAKAMVDFALDAVDIVGKIADKTGYPLKIRVGVHTGSTIGGVIGRHKMVYDYWGRAVNLASRLESSSEPNRVHISETTYWRVRDFFQFEERSNVEMRGFGPMKSFFIKST